MRVVPPPSSVTSPPPSITVSADTVIVCAIGIVIGAEPHENTIVPPAVAAVCSAAAVQLPGEPSPTVDVGDDTSTGEIGVQVAAGTPASGTPPPLPSSSPLVPLPPVPPPPCEPHAATTKTEIASAR